MGRPNPNDYILNGYEKALDKYHNYLEHKVKMLDYLLKRLGLSEEEILKGMKDNERTRNGNQ